MPTSHDSAVLPRRPAQPCPFCGKRLQGTPSRCPHCRMLLDEKTRRAAHRQTGPWFLLDARHPTAPGVSWRRFLALIEKGRVTRDSVVRGPSTHGLWRLAQDTPTVATRLGLCWFCHSPLPPDRAGNECPRCQAVLNAPEDPSASGRRAPPAPPPTDAPDAGDAPALEALVEAGATGNGPPPRPEEGPAYGPRGPLVALAVLLVLGAAGAAAIWAFLRYEDVPSAPAGSPRTAPPVVGARDPARRFPRPAPLPPGSPPGDLWPEVGEYDGPIDEPAGSPPATAPAASAARPAPAAPASRPADALDPDELARQRRTAGILMASVRRLRAAGQLMAAQAALVRMLNTHHRSAWPAGAVAVLREIQQAIRTSTSRPARIDPDELARQRAAAARLFARATRLMDRGDYLGAQKPLLSILNDHHPRAWPDGALEAFRKIQEAFRATPSTAPAFFDVQPGGS